MNLRAAILSIVARGSSVICGAVFVRNARPAGAGTNLWTNHGPEGGVVTAEVTAVAIDPITPTTRKETCP